jgi:hypothetical protein
MLPNSYDSVKVGDKVIIGRHDMRDPDDDISDNWDPDMDQYVGEEATVVELIIRADMWDAYTVKVDIDNGDYHWRVENMTLVSDVGSCREDYSKPCVCSRCGDINLYQPYKRDHVCYGCQLWDRKAG